MSLFLILQKFDWSFLQPGKQPSMSITSQVFKLLNKWEMCLVIQRVREQRQINIVLLYLIILVIHEIFLFNQKGIYKCPNLLYLGQKKENYFLTIRGQMSLVF